MLLWKEIAEESAIRCCTSATRDCKTVAFRLDHEGLSFLTITLPDFGKDFLEALDQGRVDRRLFTGFRWKRGLPRFLGGFLDRVFDRSSGALLDDPCVDAILAIRQLTLMFGKLLIPCSDARVTKALRGYIECEKEVRNADRELKPGDIQDFRRVSALLFGKSLTIAGRKVANREVFPKHGPGSTADMLLGNKKYNQRTWTIRLERVFPVEEMLLANPSFEKELAEIDFLEPGRELPVTVIPVPKTLKTPRIIAKEPTCMQYVQQALYPVILHALRRDDNLRIMLGFDNQTPNQEMARIGSLHGTLATLDLSDASDRVSNRLVRELFAPWPDLHQAVDACRSRKAVILGEVIDLAKFASMGSALTFPVEAMVFLTLIFIGIERELNAPLSPRVVKQLKEQVRVYGDDIIVPVNFVLSVVRVLESFGARVNARKSYWSGKFRESCGRDYYDGQDVSIVRVRQVFPEQRQHATEIISLVSLRNQLYWAGYWRTCKWLDGRIRSVIHHFPMVLPSSMVLGRESVLGYQTDSLCSVLQRPLVKGYRITARLPRDHLEGMGALLKYFLKPGESPSADERHLERAGRPHAVNIKLGRYSST